MAGDYKPGEQIARVLDLAARDRRAAQSSPDLEDRKDYLELAHMTLREARHMIRAEQKETANNFWQRTIEVGQAQRQAGMDMKQEAKTEKPRQQAA
jgi:hypothetical protein